MDFYMEIIIVEVPMIHILKFTVIPLVDNTERVQIHSNPYGLTMTGKMFL